MWTAPTRIICSDYEVDLHRGQKAARPHYRPHALKSTVLPMAAEVLDKMKATGYKYSTKCAMTISVGGYDCSASEAGAAEGNREERTLAIEEQYKMGFMTDEERYKAVVSEWEKTTKDVSNALQENLDRFNPIFMMADSGARGSMNQIRQLAGMRGLIANTAGKTIEIPIKANYREGLSVLEYFISSRGARKGLADTALRTADSGYLTRRHGGCFPGSHHP